MIDSLLLGLGEALNQVAAGHLAALDRVAGKQALGDVQDVGDLDAIGRQGQDKGRLLAGAVDAVQQVGAV